MKTNEKLLEILQLCLELQDSGWGDVFFDMSGHVNKVQIRGFEGRWKSELDPTFDAYSWYDNDSEYGKNLDDLVSLLKSYLS